MARPDKVLLAASFLFALVGVVLAVDLLSAIGAEACPAPDCYPWGSEGPAAAYWQYDSKAHYLASGLAKVVLPLSAAGIVGQAARTERPLSTAKRVLVAALIAVTAGLVLI